MEIPGQCQSTLDLDLRSATISSFEGDRVVLQGQAVEGALGGAVYIEAGGDASIYDSLIAGNATGNLARLGIRAVPTPPVIVMGTDVKLVFPDIPQLIIVPLVTQIGAIEMDVAFAVKLPEEACDGQTSPDRR